MTTTLDAKRQTFIATYFTDHDTAFSLQDEHITCYYTVRRSPGVRHWNIYAVTPHGKEHFIGQYFGNIAYGLLDDGEPNVTAWYHDAWSLFTRAWTEFPDSMQVTPLGHCKRCGRLLTDPRAIARGYGDECFKQLRTTERADWVDTLCESCHYRHCVDDESLLCHTCPVSLDLVDDCLVCSCVLHKRKMLADKDYVCEYYTRRSTY